MQIFRQLFRVIATSAIIGMVLPSSGAEYVIHISVDGFRPDYMESMQWSVFDTCQPPQEVQDFNAMKLSRRLKRKALFVKWRDPDFIESLAIERMGDKGALNYIAQGNGEDELKNCIGLESLIDFRLGINSRENR